MIIDYGVDATNVVGETRATSNVGTVESTEAATESRILQSQREH